MLACARIGAMICPANWRQSAEEFAFVIDDFDPKVVVWQEEEIGDQVRKARDLASSSCGVDPTRLRSKPAVTTTWWPPLARNRSLPRSTHMMRCWSSTPPRITGRPAGSMLSHRNLITMALQTGRVTGADETCIFVNSGPLFHIGNFQFDSLPVFVMGGTNVYIRRIEEPDLLGSSPKRRSRRRS